jgi:hypothetical protein
MIDLRWTKVALVVAAVVLCAGAVLANGVPRTPPSAVSQAEPCPTGVSPVRVTVQVTDVPLVDAIDYLFCGTGYKYTIQPGVAGRVSLNFVDMPLDEAVCKLATSASLGYVFDGGRYIFTPCPRVIESPCPPYGAGPNDEAKPDKECDVKRESKSEQAKQKPQALQQQIGPVTQGPVVYGNYSPRIYEAPPPMPYGGWGGCGGFGGCAPIIIGTYGGYPLGAPMVLPPPYLRPPSLQRMLAQMYAVHSTPGFPAYHIGSYSGMVDADPWAGYGGYGAY